MYQTTYIRAGSLAEAENLLRDNPEAKLIAGGQTLVPTLRQRLARASHLVDIVHLPELRGLSQDGEAVVVGASTTHAEVAASDLVRSKIPGLANLAGFIGDPDCDVDHTSLQCVAYPIAGRFCSCHVSLWPDADDFVRCNRSSAISENRTCCQRSRHGSP